MLEWIYAFVSDGRSDKAIREVDQQDGTGPLSVDSSYMSVPTPQLDQASEEVGLTSGTTEFPGNNICDVSLVEIHVPDRLVTALI